jgi:hypothetical protein
MDQSLTRHDFHKMLHEDPDMRLLFHQWLKHLILSAAAKDGSRGLERSFSQHDCSEQVRSSKYYRSESQTIEKSFREFTASFKCEVEEPSTCAVTETTEFDQMTDRQNSKRLMREKSFVNPRGHSIPEKPKELSGPYGDTKDNYVQAPARAVPHNVPSHAPMKKTNGSNVERKMQQPLAKFESRPEKMTPPSQVGRASRNDANLLESKLYESVGTMEGQASSRLVERRFRLGDHINVQAIVSDSKDRRLKSICERFNCQICIYYVKRSSGSISYVLLIQALDEESLVKCVRCIDNALKWDLFGQLKSMEVPNRGVVRIING